MYPQMFPPGTIVPQQQWHPVVCYQNQFQQWPVAEKATGSIRHKFTKAEDELLKSLVERYGENNWVAVASAMKTRSPRQCRERFKNYLSPKIQNGPWTPEEEELLAQKVQEMGQKWASIALYFEPRSDVNVKNHWTAMVNRQMRERNANIKKSLAGIISDQIETPKQASPVQSMPPPIQQLPPQPIPVQVQPLPTIPSTTKSATIVVPSITSSPKQENHSENENEYEPTPIFTPFEDTNPFSNEWNDQDLPTYFPVKDINPNDGFFVWE